MELEFDYKIIKQQRIDVINNSRKILTKQYKQEVEDLFEFLEVIKGTRFDKNKVDVDSIFSKINLPKEKPLLYTQIVALKRPDLVDDILLNCDLQSFKITKNKISKLIYTDTTYFSLNTFRKMYKSDGTSNYKVVQRSLRNLTVLNCIALDVDMDENKGVEKDEMFCNILEATQEILPCTCIVDSGNGFHIYWNIENVYLYTNKDKKIMTYKAVANYLANELEKRNIHCDKKVTGDTQRILRIPFSFNTKHCECKKCIIDYSDYSIKYDLLELRKKLNLNFESKKVKINNINELKKIELKIDKPKVKHNIKRSDKEYDTIPSGFELYNDFYPKRNCNRIYFYQVTIDRIEDIKMFIKAKDTENGYYNGRRYEIMMLVVSMIARNNFECEEHSLEPKSILLDINECFTEKLSNERINDLLRLYEYCMKDLCYLYKKNIELLNGTKERRYTVTNEHLVNILGLTPTDMSYSRIIMNENEKKRRKSLRLENGKQLRASNKALKIQKENDEVDALLKQNLTVAKIIETLSGKYSASKVKRIIKRIKDK